MSVSSRKFSEFFSVALRGERTKRTNNVASDRVWHLLANHQAQAMQQLANIGIAGYESKMQKTSSANSHCRDLLLQPGTEPGLSAILPGSAALLEWIAIVLISRLLARSSGVRQ